MISFFCALLTLTTSFILSGQIDILLDNLDHKVEIQVDRELQFLTKSEAKSYIQNWMKSLNDPQVIRSHSSRHKQSKDTYGLYHIEDANDSYRFFYFSSINGSSDKITKVKIIKV